ncbi:uncharacterized protein BJX67DRAFT_198042 [Aspergillus lucknowensis]|uniref:Uncharacterized protein n=1 Tax=Aspergillus lucknowensis TaxID=176173 RepID=A0ABR4LK98_9EURO
MCLLFAVREPGTSAWQSSSRRRRKEAEEAGSLQMTESSRQGSHSDIQSSPRARWSKRRPNRARRSYHNFSNCDDGDRGVWEQPWLASPNVHLLYYPSGRCASEPGSDNNRRGWRREVSLPNGCAQSDTRLHEKAKNTRETSSGSRCEALNCWKLLNAQRH